MLRYFRIYVAKHEIEIVLLWREILDKLGFNIKQHLMERNNQVQNLEFSQEENCSSKSKKAYSGVTHDDTDEDPISPPVDLNEQFGDDGPNEIDEMLDARVRAAKEKGLSDAGAERLRRSIAKYKSIFGVKLGSKPPADLEPYKVQLKAGAHTIRATQRRYGPAQKEFIESTIKNLEAINAVYKNPTAKWASPELAVPKPGTEQLRFTVDFVAVNSRTCLLYTSPSPRDQRGSRMPSSA